MMTPIALRQILAPYLPKDWPLHTRLQSSNGFFPAHFMIKREDEQSSSIQGAKFRKYAGLTAYWQDKGIRELAIWGNAFSNNVLGLTQLANAYNLGYSLHLLANQAAPLFKGNHLWLRMSARDDATIHYWEREAWHQQPLPEPLLQSRHLTIPEGARMAACLPGCLTLGLEIIEQEATYGLAFKDVFIDAGTGLTAIGLLLALACLGHADRTVHITLISGNAEQFEKDLAAFRHSLQEFGLHVDPASLPAYKFHRPPSAKAFGAINQTTLTAVKELARTEGIITDPVYGAKHALSALAIAREYPLTGPSLFIHDGGGLTLAGFQQPLAAVSG